VTTTASAATTSADQSSHTCGCHLHSAPRTTRAAQKFSASPEIVAAVANVTDAPLPLTPAAEATRFTAVAAPEPIPHRILHCSWII
jgi:hypothetical protein